MGNILLKHYDYDDNHEVIGMMVIPIPIEDNSSPKDVFRAIYKKLSEIMTDEERENYLNSFPLESPYDNKKHKWKDYKKEIMAESVAIHGELLSGEGVVENG